MEKILNYINGSWVEPSVDTFLDVIDPGTGELIAKTPVCGNSDLDAAAKAAEKAFPGWRRMPAQERIQFLFALRDLLKDNLNEISNCISRECGKTFEESKAEMIRAIENVEVACGIPMLGKGEISEDVAIGIDEIMIRQPVGVCATICPFNFPGMIPFWYLPYAIACGNTYIIKPSEKVPLTMQYIFRLLDQIGLPDGVINLVNGAKEVVDAILEHPVVRGITFVGSSSVARYVYRKASENGKRVQAQGGAKNPVVIMPDADLEMAVKIIADSAFGCAGQRCLAVSWAVTVGDTHNNFLERICDAAESRVVGYGLEKGVQMGPVISRSAQERITHQIQQGIGEGATVCVDGRNAIIKKHENGFYLRPTILDNIMPGSGLSQTEIFGPVLSLVHANSLNDAMGIVNQGKFGNQASIFTSSGAAARTFRNEAQAGNIGVNIGVAAPMAYYPFSGWKDSFYGDMHGQGMDAVEFFTQKKVVVERWPKEWSRKF
jgi:malonate-semialdehyde dehydrogenase (acetylating)/methylmalonate-semialdehyde dehydrogenase